MRNTCVHRRHWPKRPATRFGASPLTFFLALNESQSPDFSIHMTLCTAYIVFISHIVGREPHWTIEAQAEVGESRRKVRLALLRQIVVIR